MVFSCRRIPCQCASSKAQDAAECWCVREVDSPVCLRSSCKAPMRKTSPATIIAEIGAALADAARDMGADCERMMTLIDEDHRKQTEMRKTSPGVPVASGIREGELADKNDPRG